MRWNLSKAKHARGFFLCGVTRKLTEDDMMAVNFYTEPKVRFLAYQYADTKPKQMLKKYAGVYEVVTDIDIGGLEEMIEGFESAKEVVITNPNARYFSGLYQKKTNLKSQDVFYEFGGIRAMKGIREGRFKVKLNAAVGIRHFLKGVLDGISFARILKFEVMKLQFYERVKNESRTERLL